MMQNAKANAATTVSTANSKEPEVPAKRLSDVQAVF
jgi:hypothetical protein